MKSLKNLNKTKIFIKNIIIILLSLALLLTVFQVYHLFAYYKMSPKASVKCQIINEYVLNSEEYSYEYDRYDNTLAKLFDTPHILQYSMNGWQNNNQIGRSQPLFRRIVLRSKFYWGIESIKAYAHELAHVKYQTFNDCYVTYKAIITLYESDNTFHKYVAVEYANDVLSGGYADTSYDCGYYLLEYFSKTNEKLVYF